MIYENPYQISRYTEEGEQADSIVVLYDISELWHTMTIITWNHLPLNEKSEIREDWLIYGD